MSNPSGSLNNKFDNEDLKDWRRPLVSKVTFNTNTFADRKAVVGDESLQYYMMLKPLTKFPSSGCGSGYEDCENRIDKMIFRLPDEFGYPSKRDLLGCDRYGVI